MYMIVTFWLSIISTKKYTNILTNVPTGPISRSSYDMTIDDRDEYSWSMRDGEDEEWIHGDPSYVNHGDGEELGRVVSLVD